jgi:hypothetical protein
VLGLLTKCSGIILEEVLACYTEGKRKHWLLANGFRMSS